MSALESLLTRLTAVAESATPGEWTIKKTGEKLFTETWIKFPSGQALISASLSEYVVNFQPATALRLLAIIRKQDEALRKYAAAETEGWVVYSNGVQVPANAATVALAEVEGMLNG